MAENVTESDTQEVEKMAGNKKFNLTELLNQRSKEVAAEEVPQKEADPVNTTADGVSGKADIYDLIPSKENFYSVEDVQDLKQSIELLGVLQPLLVADEEDGKRRIIAGHRRRLAIMQLVEEGKERFRYVPILIKPTKSAILDKLALIMANRFREKTDWEKMTEALETEALVLKLKESMSIPGRTRDLLAEIIETSPAQVGRYKAIYNNLSQELMAEFKANRIGVSVIYEASGLPEDYQKQAAEIFRENEILTLPDIKQLKKNYEASKPIPGQISIEEATGQQEKQYKTRYCEHMADHSCNYEARQEVATNNGMDCKGICCTNCEQQQECGAACNHSRENVEEYEEPQPESITSICYSCTKYETCHEKKATITNCNAYENRREAQKTAEERYDEEQAEIDRQTAKKLREMQQEEKMQQLPSEQEARKHDIRLAHTKFEEITSGKLTFLLLKKDDYKLNEEITIPEYKDGAPTGRSMDIEITYILQDWSGLEEDYCILGFALVSYDVAAVAAEEAGKDAAQQTLQPGA